MTESLVSGGNWGKWTLHLHTVRPWGKQPDVCLRPARRTLRWRRRPNVVKQKQEAEQPLTAPASWDWEMLIKEAQINSHTRYLTVWAAFREIYGSISTGSKTLLTHKDTRPTLATNPNNGICQTAEKTAKRPSTEQAINSQLLLIWLIKEKLLPSAPGRRAGLESCLRVTLLISGIQQIYTRCLV